MLMLDYTDARTLLTKSVFGPNAGVHYIPTAARGYIREVLRRAHRDGMSLIFSSAWDDFSETYQRITDLELLDLVDGDEDREQHLIPRGEDESELAQVIQQGRIISVRALQKASETFIENLATHLERYPNGVIQNDSGDIYQGDWFRLKHLALDHAKDLKGKEWDAVVFIDDSYTNRDIFKQQMKETRWYENVKEVHILSFTEIDGETNDEDLPGRYSKPEEVVIGLELSEMQALAYHMSVPGTVLAYQGRSDRSQSPIEFAKIHWREHGHEDEKIVDRMRELGYVYQLPEAEEEGPSHTASASSEVHTISSDDELTDVQAEQYLANYADLQAAAAKHPEGQRLNWAKRHYRRHGQRERRSYEHVLTNAQAKQYLANYADLRAAAAKHPEDQRLNWAKKHYRTHGQREGRSFVAK